ncbi:MAG TPA: carboxypeptidase regulatory-like domain-containing protein [Caldimonas sp.]|jgi:plastocyanin
MQPDGLRKLLIAMLCMPALSLAATLNGRVVLAGTAPAAKKIDVTIDQYLCGNQKEAQDLILSARNEVANAVVWLENPPPGATWPAGENKATVDQNGCVFVPRVAIVPVGGTVDFLNTDRLLHNIHAQPKLNEAFNRTQPKNRTVPVTFSKAEIVRVDCDLHSWMTAWVVVAPHPYYAVTRADGQFSFEGLPPGSYRLQIWHERLGPITRQVIVPATGGASVSVEMKLP